MGRETGHLHLLAPLLLTGGKGADLVIRGDVVLNSFLRYVPYSLPSPILSSKSHRSSGPVLRFHGPGAKQKIRGL
jgi:hypothetical protein